MKKILTIIIVLGCLLAFASCGGSQQSSSGNNGETPADASSIQAIVDASAPKSAVIKVTLSSEIGDLNGQYNVVYNDDGSANIVYSYEQFNTYDAAGQLGELKSVVSGEVTVSADGTVNGTISGVGGIQATSFVLNLDNSKLSGLVAEGGSLQATVPAANTASVLGISTGADVSLSVMTGSGVLTSVAMSYQSAEGTVSIACSYGY